MYRVPSTLAPLLFVPGLAYEAMVRLRNRAYSANLLRQSRLDSPAISIGNLTMGGTGKTPLVIYIAQLLLRMGRAPAVLSRGYRRRSGQMYILTPKAVIQDPASELGDEPALIRRRVPSAWLGISQNRFEAGARLEQKHNLTFLLDDGFQHRSLFRNIDIVVVDGSQSLENNRVFPRGTLREPLSALRRSDLIVVHGDSQDIARTQNTARRLGCKAEILECEQKITAIVPFPDWQRAGQTVSAPAETKAAFAAAALGNPHRFLNDLNRAGIEMKGEKFFPDHHKISRRDWIICCEEARRKGAESIIVTEKDAIKITDLPDFPLMVAVQSVQMRDADILENILKERL
jgi:tetraacyldisaccharide 4'-kinase